MGSKHYSRIVSLVAVSILLAVSGYASDEFNMCIFNRNPESANISLPTDDAYHYPGQWTGDPDKVNLNSRGNGQESTYKVWHWTAIPLGKGKGRCKPVRIDGFQTYAAIQEDGGGWNKMLWVSILGPDNDYLHYFYAAPGEFSPCENCYDLGLGGSEEQSPYIVEIVDGGREFFYAPNLPFIGKTVGAGGTNMSTDFVSTDGQIEIHTQEESLKRPNYPGIDGYDDVLKYYWARSYLASWGTVTYKGTTYDVYGSAWDDREWLFDKPALLHNQRWHWTAIQIKGCLDKRGRKIPCNLTTTTINAWDNFYNISGHPQHYWSEVGPPPYCADFTLTEQEDWTLEPLEFWTSPRTGIEFATKVRLTAPSRGADLVITARAEDQEVYKATIAINGLWEGGADVVGTLEGKRVWGEAMLEQYKAPTDPDAVPWPTD